MKRLVLAFVLLLAASSAASASDRVVGKAEDLTDPDLPNFSRVDAHLYRGGQPNAAGLQKLRQRGIQTVVNLRGGSDWEAAAAEAAGLRYVALPVDSLNKVPAADVKRFLDIVDDPAMQPVFVHCRQGRDRTGVMVAIYRMERQDWEPSRAGEELKQHGHHWYFVDLRKTLGDYDDLPTDPLSRQSFWQALSSHSFKYLAMGFLRLREALDKD